MFGDLIGLNTKGEVDAHIAKERRRVEAVAAYNANDKDYRISPESLAALERGDRQRETGIYQTSVDTEYVPPCLAKTAGDGVFGEHICKLDKGHVGDHECVGVGYCNKVWAD